MAKNTILVNGVEYVEADSEECKNKFGMKEFSKKVVFAVSFLWFLGAIYGMAYVWKYGQGIEALLSYVGAPMVGGVISYMLKTAFENKEKEKTRAAGLNNCSSQDN